MNDDYEGKWSNFYVVFNTLEPKAGREAVVDHIIAETELLTEIHTAA